MRSKMSSTFPSLLSLFCALLISQVAFTNCANHVLENVVTDAYLLKNPFASLYFRLEDLQSGNKMRLCFPVTSPYKKITFFSRKSDDPFPFSSKYLSQLLRIFSFSENSSQGKAIATTLKLCESYEQQPIGGGESNFCATSLESMVEQVRGVLGLDVEIDLLSTELSRDHKVDLQNYTVLEEPNDVATPKLVGCDPMAYPYRVYICHPQLKDPLTVFKVAMVGDDGEKINVVAACNQNTTSWDQDHIAFKVLNTQPGKSVICHFLPVNYFAWVSSPSTV